MSDEDYDRIPEPLILRDLRFGLIVPERRTETITAVITLTDAQAYSKENLAELYGFRWSVELDIRALKQTLGSYQDEPSRDRHPHPPLAKGGNGGLSRETGPLPYGRGSDKALHAGY